MCHATTSTIAAAMVVAISLAPQPAISAEPEQIVDALGTVFGKHKSRASGAKGQCVTGMFTPTSDARQMTKSASFQKPVPVLGRFSIGGGNPKAPDTAKPLVRGFAFKLDPNGTSPSEFVMVNAPVNFAKTPAQMLGFLQARFPGADGKQDPEKIKAFAAANPETTRQGAWLTSRPLPASYVGVNYWGIHAYTMTNASGKAQLIKFKLVPTGGEAGLSDDEAKAKPADFLVAELTDRIGRIRCDGKSRRGRRSDQRPDHAVARRRQAQHRQARNDRDHGHRKERSLRCRHLRSDEPRRWSCRSKG
jgi:catalase